MKPLHIIIVLTGISWAATLTESNAQELSLGLFAASKEGAATGGHGIRERTFSTVAAPNIKGLKQGWNFRRNSAGKKHGLQVYLDRKRISIEHFDNGVRTATGSFRSGKAHGWFNRYDAKKKKHGAQHYFDGTYRSYEYYEHGVKVASGSYRRSRPEGWFYFYKNGKRHGVQKYVAKSHWSFATYHEGREHGTSGTIRRGLRDGWFYQWKNGKKTGRTYFKMGKKRRD